jgi:DNA-binding transcriptional ArsR family regulator
MSEASFRVSEIMEVLGNPIRYRILTLIDEHGERTSAQLARSLRRTVSSISHHLSPMKKLDLVYAQWEGRKVQYGIKRKDILKVVKQFERLVMRAKDSDEPGTD